jgi:hypothetical protein
VSTFIVRFVRQALDSFCGRVRHVATGEETGFSSPAELLAFMEEMNVVCGLSALSGGDPKASREDRDETPDSRAVVGPLQPTDGRRRGKVGQAPRAEGGDDEPTHGID